MTMAKKMGIDYVHGIQFNSFVLIGKLQSLFKKTGEKGCYCRR